MIFGVCVCVYMYRLPMPPTFSELSLYFTILSTKSVGPQFDPQKRFGTSVFGASNWRWKLASNRPTTPPQWPQPPWSGHGVESLGFFPTQIKRVKPWSQPSKAEYLLGMKVNHWYGFKDSSIRFLASKDEIESLQKIHRNSHQSQTLPTLIAQPKTLADGHLIQVFASKKACSTNSSPPTDSHLFFGKTRRTRNLQIFLGQVKGRPHSWAIIHFHPSITASSSSSCAWYLGFNEVLQTSLFASLIQLPKDLTHAFRKCCSSSPLTCSWVRNC